MFFLISFSSGNGKGDACELDEDGDGIPNILDNCPNNSMIYATDFRSFRSVILDPEGESQADPHWVVLANGSEITQTLNSDPGLVVGQDAFGGVDYFGTLFVNTHSDDDYVGFMFSYQSNRKFYVVMWKKKNQKYWIKKPFVANGKSGLQIKLIDSETGPSKTLGVALWHAATTNKQTKLLWIDPKNQGWIPKVPYRWHLIHRPAIGLIRVK